MTKILGVLILVGAGFLSTGQAGDKDCAVKTSAKVKAKSSCAASQAACCPSKSVKTAKVTPLTKGATLLARR